MKLAYRSVLVTGANRGVGRAFVEDLLNRGVRRVYAAARDTARLATTIGLDPQRVVALELDVTDPATVAEAARQAADTTVLINNAGVLSLGGALEVESAAIVRDMSVNFSGLLDTTRAIAPVIAANGGGAVVNMLSLLSFVSVPGFSAYNASKAAAWSISMSLRPLLASQGISVINAFPAGIDTDMLAGVDSPKDDPAQVAAEILDAIEAGEEDVYPGAARNIYDSWRADHKAVERLFAAMG